MKLPKGRGAPILYLDFDGVLHNDACFWRPRRGAYLEAGPGYTLFQHVGILEDLLQPHPDIRIVLSTSWVRRYRYSGAAKRLPEGLRARVIGATFHSQMEDSSFREKPRWKQIWEDVVRRAPGSWLAVDNDVAGWPPELERHLVASEDERGISPPEIQHDLRRRLILLSNLLLPATGPAPRSW